LTCEECWKDSDNKIEVASDTLEEEDNATDNDSEESQVEAVKVIDHLDHLAS